MSGLLFFSCVKEETSLKDYYYSVPELEEGIVYEYRSPAEDSVQFPPFYWLYQRIKSENGAEVLRGTNYDQHFQIEQITTEQVVDNGVILQEFHIYEYDENGKPYITKTEIKEGGVFPFTPDNKNVMPFIVSWRSGLDTASSTTLIRGRVFQAFEDCNFQGKTLPCVRFLSADQIEADHDIDGGQLLDVESQEWFAKGIGLVKVRKKIGKMEVGYNLIDQYSIEKFEQMKSDHSKLNHIH